MIDRRGRAILFTGAIAAALILILTSAAGAQTMPIPNVSLTIGGPGGGPAKTATVIQLLFILTVLSLAPAILLLLTSFTRIVVVLSLLRHALGTQQIPPNQVIIGLALFMTFFIMAPVWNQIHTEALKPYYDEEISGEEAMDRAAVPIKGFMLKQTREKDLALFIKMSQGERPRKPTDVPLTALIPAFVISELKTAFQIGFMIYLPFFVIDMVVSSILLSMGMMMLPPIMLSLPFKLLLFVLVDGWNLVVTSLVRSFQ
ncbi:MAG TPA: flagellar type III secretion system pore protein FliP [Syntrophales bacterium]|nr:flagellar type III secretion system pore protein FliP [Syntrophales bacterium]